MIVSAQLDVIILDDNEIQISHKNDKRVYHFTEKLVGKNDYRALCGGFLYCLKLTLLNLSANNLFYLFYN